LILKFDGFLKSPHSGENPSALSDSTWARRQVSGPKGRSPETL